MIGLSDGWKSGVQFTIQCVIHDAQGNVQTHDVITLDKPADTLSGIGLSLHDSKALLKALQQTIVRQQAEHYSKTHIDCAHCQKKRRAKGHHTIQYRTLFGIVRYPAYASITARASHQKPGQ